MTKWASTILKAITSDIKIIKEGNKRIEFLYVIEVVISVK